ncbi:MAG: PQQ-dependent sugar dehydrogenase [Candidatus Hydrogenedentota bacterium]
MRASYFYSALLLSVASTGCREPVPVNAVLIADGFDRPTFVTSPPGDASRLFVTEQNTGQIWIIDNGERLAAPFLDIGDKVSDGGGEIGLYSIAFHPDYDVNGFFYVFYYNNDDVTVVERYEVTADPNLADPDSATEILRVTQPETNHNGGQLAFGPNDGYLYIGFGDGGGQNDPSQNGQDLSTRLGKLLRIDVDSEFPFAIPPDNPFVGVAGADPAIWAYGLRNPWRFSFDAATGDLYIGDVGQFDFEEIDFQPASSLGGENYGWSIAEGFECRGGGGACGTDEGFTPPIHAYPRVDGRSVTGGYVYRGSAVPGLDGTYFFADYLSARIWSFRVVDGAATEFTDRTAEIGTFPRIASFGQGADGEIYIVTHDAGSIFRLGAAEE